MNPALRPFLEIGLTHYLVLSSLMFSLGILAMVARRNAIGVLIGIELILNAANVNLVAFGRFTDAGPQGPVFAIFVIMLAAAEAAIALALLLSLFERSGSVSLDEASELKG
ncbi:MAG: NADH-quinone oxidoreductase subunit NuoK [Planctomycetes bacterium]|nr:NADH-quinone oxidoreductase subunit NuoK [Planctomycetota bacterium]